MIKTDLQRKSNNEYILRRDIDESNLQKFEELMNAVDWNLITYDQAFPLQKIKIKWKSLVSPWNYKGDYKIFKEETVPL